MSEKLSRRQLFRLWLAGLIGISVHKVLPTPVLAAQPAPPQPAPAKLLLSYSCDHDQGIATTSIYDASGK
jgi:hypothetical protein